MTDIIAMNATRTTEYIQYYVPSEYVLILGFIAFFACLLLVTCIYDFSRMRRVLDFYRMKYSFDRELESKDTTDKKKLDFREERFKRRTFKD